MLHTSPGAGRFVLGTSRLDDPSSAYSIYDEYFEAGGRWFDTARVYRGGRSETVLGGWLTATGVASEVHVLGKGGHPELRSWTPRVAAALVVDDARASLDALGIERFEEYLLHRDDHAFDVETLLEGLRLVRDEGVTRAIGVSNWNRTRFARASQLERISLSNYFGLAVPGAPSPLPGLASSFDSATHELIEQQGTVLYAWGALSGGFFEGVGSEAGLYSTHPDSIRRRSVLAAISARSGRTAETILVRWLATCGDHIRPLISTTRPGRVASLLAAADDNGLDPLVAELVDACAGAPNSPNSPNALLLPHVPPIW